MAEYERALDIIRKRAAEKYEEVLCDPNATAKDRERFSLIRNFYYNINFIRKHRIESTHCTALMWLGFSRKEAIGEGGLYERLMKEIDKQYIFVAPDYIKMLEKKAGEAEGRSDENSPLDK